MRDYWADDVAALAMSTPLGEIRIDEISSENLVRLGSVLEEIRVDSESATNEFEVRYRAIRNLLETRDPGS